MSGKWVHNNRRPLPRDWKARRRVVRDRAGGQCEAIDNGVRCTAVGTDCDHINDNLDHSPSNLRWLCRTHHNMHTQKQAKAASKAIRAKAKHPMSR